MNIKYSFVVPAYNNKNNLRRSMVSILSQVQSNNYTYELVIVDDGSSQVLESELVEFRRNSKVRFIRLERSECSSRSRARNMGWRAARGEYIVFVDSDILVKPTHLQELDRYFGHCNRSLVIGNRIHVFNQNCDKEFKEVDFQSSNKNYAALDYRSLAFSSESFNGRAIGNSWLYAYSCNFSLSKVDLLKVDGFDERILDWGIEDLELAYRLHRSGVNILINPKLEVLHQSEAHRDDVAISSARLVGYRKNIDYFLLKHPEALCDCDNPMALLIDGQHFVEHSPLHKIVKYYDGDSLESVKRHIEAIVSKGTQKIILYDYCEESGLDVWVQLVSTCAEKILYFPMSKKVDVGAMMQFVIDQRHIRSSVEAESSLPA